MSNDERWWSMFSAEEMKEIEDNIERQAYHRSGVKEGIEIGTEQGIEQGIEQTNIKIAQKMLNENFSEEVILSMTGFTLDDIKVRTY